MAARAPARRAAGLDQAPGPAGPADDGLELWYAFHEVAGPVFYRGWGQAQVAEGPGATGRTARRLWASARERLRKLLGGRFPAEEG